MAGIIPEGLAEMMLKEQVAAAVQAAARAKTAAAAHDGIHLRRSHQSAAAAVKVNFEISIFPLL